MLSVTRFPKPTKKLKLLLCSFALLGLALPGCGHKPPPKKANPNAGKHQLAQEDPRSWDTYPAIVLIAAKHHVGPDTVAHLLRGFETRFSADAAGPRYEAQLTTTNYNTFEEDTPSVSEDMRFFATEGQRYKLYPSAVEDIITDFYILGGSNRDFPERNAE